jgi:hypothetical protein
MRGRNGLRNSLKTAVAKKWAEVKTGYQMEELNSCKAERTLGRIEKGFQHRTSLFE